MDKTFLEIARRRLLEVTLEGSLSTRMNSIGAMAEGDIPIAEKPNKENEERGDFKAERQSSKHQSILKYSGEGFYRPYNSNFKFPKRSWVEILRKSPIIIAFI